MNIWGYEKKIKEIKIKLKNKDLSFDRIEKLKRRLKMNEHLLIKEREKQGKVKKIKNVKTK